MHQLHIVSAIATRCGMLYHMFKWAKKKLHKHWRHSRHSSTHCNPVIAAATPTSQGDYYNWQVQWDASCRPSAYLLAPIHLSTCNFPQAFTDDSADTPAIRTPNFPLSERSRLLHLVCICEILENFAGSTACETFPAQTYTYVYWMKRNSLVYSNTRWS